jgi:hypothetical protein
VRLRVKLGVQPRSRTIDDPLEHEADRVASQVIHLPTAGPAKNPRTDEMGEIKAFMG